MKEFKKITKKVLLVLFVMVMLFSSVLADVANNPSNQVTNEGNRIENVNGDNVSISKTIEQSSKENFFDITLQVETETLVKNIKVDQDIAVVLVLDTSSSMTWCTTPYYQNGVLTHRSCNNNVSDQRITVAKNAIYEFTEVFFNKQSDTARRELGLVTFSKDASKKVLLGSATSTSQTAFDDVVRAITTSTGTNLGDGLVKGKEVLDATDIKNKYLIVLTDGYPTVYGSPGGSVASNDYGDQAGKYASEKAAINRDAGIKTFTIGVGFNSQRSYVEIDDKYAVGYTTNETTTTSRGQYSFSTNIETGKEVVLVRENDTTAMSVDNNGNVILKTLPNPPTDNDLWIIESSGSGYRLKNKKTGTYLNRDGSTPILSTTGMRFYTEYSDNSHSAIRFYNGSRYIYVTSSYGTNYWRIGESNYYRNMHIGVYTPGKTTTTEKYTTTPAHFKLWLGGKKVVGSALDSNGQPLDPTKVEEGGIGYIGNMTDEDGNPVSAYYDAEDVESLLNAYTSIFKEIEREIDILNKAWTATDPMNSTSTELPKYISFEDFYNFEDTLVESLDGTNSVNIAEFDTENDSIIWNLRESDPTKTVNIDPNDPNKKRYIYELKYRVRLKNELPEFEEWKSLPTNGDAKLTYALVDEDGNITELKTADFPVPEVRGYLGTLEFTKEDNEGNKLEGGVFYLIHDDNCECKKYSDEKDEKEYMIQELDKDGKPTDSRYIATSDKDGKVKFSNIPSGHKYVLKEIVAPDNYELSDETYDVTVSYDETTSNTFNFKFINTLDSGYLIVRKLLNDEYVDTTKTFKIKLNAKSGIYETIMVDEDDEEIEGTEGTITAGSTFELKHNEAIKIKLPAGTNYKIEEIDNDGYITTYEKQEGKIIQKGVVKAKVKNKTKPTKIDARKEWKNMEGYRTYPEVVFGLYRSTDGNVYNKVTEVTLDGTVDEIEIEAWYVEFTNLPGEYMYKVREESQLENFITSTVYDEENKVWVVTNTNTMSVELPETGSSAELILVLMGVGMMLLSFVYGCKYCLKK